MNSNLLLDPYTELETVITQNLFGLNSSLTEMIIEESFPITKEDKASVREQTRKEGKNSEKVFAKAKLGYLEGSVAVVVLDMRGYTLESTITRETKSFPQTTFESLEALLITTSPAYVEAMTREVAKRFESIAQDADA